MALRFGYCLNMAAKDAEGVGDANIGYIRAAGADYAELPLTSLMLLSEDELTRRVREPLSRLGIPCESNNNFFPSDMKLTGDDARKDKLCEYARRALERGSGLGSRVVVFGSGGARCVPDGFDRERAREQLVDLLRALAPIARDSGMSVAVEHLNKSECNIVNTFGEGAALVRDVGEAEVGMLADYYHMKLAGEDVCVISAARGLVRHAHIACPLFRQMPRAGDGEDYAAFFGALAVAGYDSRVSVEAGMSHELSGVYGYLRSL